MISVLIPIFNYNTTPLVASIHQQLEMLPFNFEIICICDASTEFLSENESIKSYAHTQLISLKDNIGRSKIRNLLVEKSNYNWLLFLDADVFPKSKLFIKKYLDLIENRHSEVYCGGLIYKQEKPKSEKILRWVYGKKREEISVKRRRERPFQFVTGANILIHKSVFNSLRFNEEIVNYGYEDVVFIEDLKLNLIEVNHIYNPVFHLGIENNLVFLKKTKEGLENLYLLNSKNILKGENLKLLRTFRVLKILKLTWFVVLFFNIFEKLLEYNLLSSKPYLLLFDIYKIGFFCTVYNAKRE